MSVERQESSVIASLHDLLRLEAERLEDEARLAEERAQAVREANRIAIEAARINEAKRVADADAAREAELARERERQAKIRAIEEGERLRVIAEEARKTQLATVQAEIERDVRIKAIEEDAKKRRLRGWLGAVCAEMAITVVSAGAYYAGVVAPANRAQQQALAQQHERIASLQAQVMGLTAKLAEAKTPEEVQAIRTTLATTVTDLNAAQNAAKQDPKKRVGNVGVSPGSGWPPSGAIEPKNRPTCKEGDPMAQLDCVKR